MYAANRSIPHKVVHLDTIAVAIKTKRFHCCIEADLVAKFEAVGYRLFWTIDPYDYAVEFMGLYALRIRLAGKEA